MLAIFHKAFAHPPEELNSPSSHKKPKLPHETLHDFVSLNPHNTFHMSFGHAAVLAFVRPFSPNPLHQMLFSGYDDIYCLFKGSLDNLCRLIKEYGLSKTANEAMLVIEAYRTLRDRGPYPADQVIKNLDGRFGFVVYDSKSGTVFTALGTDEGVKLYWGIAGDGSVVISDDLEVIKAGCANSFAPFPQGFIFHSEGGLVSFEHPMNQVKAMPRVDSQGVICGANFKVDKFTRINSMPRSGSAANWSQWDTQMHEAA
ncbi:hypothetical protein RND81_12G233000 [Saponaria officinalis]|uniref:DUF3700 domain-containing protein n=1 Tax=Saponaria officinalis TaxID=3572 RepID=A0AAW1HEI6_SAPOF